MPVELFDRNALSRTWMCRGPEATAVVEANAALEATLAEINRRFDEAAKPVLAECGETEKAVRARHEAEIAAMRAGFAAKIDAARAPFHEEARKASDAYHAVIYGLVPEMSRGHLPAAVLNYHAISGVVMITERLDETESGASN